LIFCQQTKFISLLSALLQGIRGEGPQLHALCLASAAI